MKSLDFSQMYLMYFHIKTWSAQKMCIRTPVSSGLEVFILIDYVCLHYLYVYLHMYTVSFSGMTINSTCCHGNGYTSYSVAPGYAGAYATNQGIVQITPKGTVYYHAAQCSLPPSYESVFRIDNQGNPVPIMEDSPLTGEPDLIRTTRGSREAWPPQEQIRSHQVMSVSSQHSQPIRGHHSPSRALPCGCASGRASLPVAE